MQITKIETSQPKRKISNFAAAAAGAVAGAGSYALLPTRKQLSAIINKETTDSFISSAALKARTANRSLAKYAGLGALAAVGMNLLSKVFAPKTQSDTSIEYSKWGAIIDASDYACMVTWYGDADDSKE